MNTRDAKPKQLSRIFILYTYVFINNFSDLVRINGCGFGLGTFIQKDKING